MPRIACVETASPLHRFTQPEIKEFARDVFASTPGIDRYMAVFDNAQVHERQLAVELDWFNESHDFTDANNQYIETALDLCETAVTRLAQKSGISTRDFDVVFLISTTGLSTPSLEARLANRIEMNPHIKRVPIWGLGCAGGASGIARAHEYLLAFPKHRALVLSVELCGLAFQKTDFSKTNLISSALFGDGAAACLMIGDEVGYHSDTPLPSTLSSLSTLYPDSLDVMSWNVTSEGFKVQLSRDIPSIVTSLVKGNVLELLKTQELELSQIEHFVMHPGGMKVLLAYAEGLGISIDKLKHSVGVLNDHGNMSSVTILFILKRFLEMPHSKKPQYGLLSALGPGFSSELVLVQWR